MTTFAATICLAAATLHPQTLDLVDTLEVVHHNKHYSDDGRLVIDQVWWESWTSDRHKIEAWRINRCDPRHCPVPIRDHARGCHVSIWFDGDVLRVVRCASFRESWTQGSDPELLDRAQYKDFRAARRGLSN